MASANLDSHRDLQSHESMLTQMLTTWLEIFMSISEDYLNPGNVPFTKKQTKDIKMQKVQMFSRKMYKCFSNKSKNRKKNCNKPNLLSRFKIQQKIAKIYYTDYISQVFHQGSFQSKFFGSRFKKRWLFQILGLTIISVPGPTFTFPCLKCPVLGISSALGSS